MYDDEEYQECDHSPTQQTTVPMIFSLKIMGTLVYE